MMAYPDCSASSPDLDITFIVRARRALTGRRALQARVLIA